MKHLLLTILIWLSGTMGLAHSPIKTTIPADGGTINVAPEQLQMTFNSGIRLTRVTVAFNDTQEIDLDLATQNGFSNDHMIPLQDLGAGVYAVVWRGLGEDGHAQTGAFTFTVE